MKQKKKYSKGIVYIPFLFVAIIILFFLYSRENSRYIEEQNKNYAADSARQTVEHIEREFQEAVSKVSAYAYFIGEGLSTPTITLEMLKNMEEVSGFDAFRFADKNGVNWATNGRTSDATDRDFYINGMNGEKGVSVLLNSRITNEAMVGFYAPVYYKGDIIGVLRGAYWADEYLKDMLSVSYFGQKAGVFLCTIDGMVIASSGEEKYEKNLLDSFLDSNVIDKAVYQETKNIFEHGGEGSFLCSSGSKIDNICVMHFPESEYVFVQTFPKDVTQAMIRNANRTGILLESSLLSLFIFYLAFVLFQAGREKRQLEQENREMGHVIHGVNTLFTRYVMVDFEKDSYAYLTGTIPQRAGFPSKGNYKDFAEYLCSFIIKESERKRYEKLLNKDNIIEELGKYRTDIRYECHIHKNGQEEWEHLNIICLERKNGKVTKVLFIRQNITEVKEKELRIQAEITLANRKERQYRVAITSDSIWTYDFNLTRDLIDRDIVDIVDGKEISLLKMVGLKIPCKASEWFEKWKQFIVEESLSEYSNFVNMGYLKSHFTGSGLETNVEFSYYNFSGKKICVRQSFIMTEDEETKDIIVMVVTKDITEQVKRQKEQTEALQEALKQAQHASHAKTIFLSNMSHDIRTPMNAIIGFATIAISHKDQKEQVNDCLQKILSSSNHLLHLINDILDMSRIESGKVHLNEQECNLAELIHNLVSIVYSQIKAKQLELYMDTFHITKEDIIADSLKLNQIFLNLISNAVKYTKANGAISFRIIQKESKQQGYGSYVFILKDNGIGMAAEFVEHIFEPFEREATTTQTGIEGTGLGMAITKNIIDMMNGTITVESEVGKGSTFTVELDLKLQDKEEDDFKKKIQKLSKQNVLIIDKDIDTCHSIGAVIAQLGMEFDYAISTEEAINYIRKAYKEERNFRTYIIDSEISKMNGIEIVKEIHKLFDKDKEIPEIIMISYEWSSIEKEARAFGVTAFCTKPMFPSDLKAILLSANNLTESIEEKEDWTFHDFSGRRILLVDDIELNREIAEVILIEIGFTVETAPDGTDAVARMKEVEEHYYDAILMDVQMPIMNGYEATRTIRALAREDVKTMPIIAMTANALEEDKEAALMNGMNAHIPKPFNMDDFIEVLSHYIK